MLAVRKIAGEALRRIPTPVWRRLVPKPAIGLCYHLVSDVARPHVRHYRPLTTAEFENDLAYLKGNFVFISYDELSHRQEGVRAPRENPVILTLDDGFAECATVVAPILLRHGLPCVIFVITDLIDNSVLFHESVAALCIDAIVRRSTPEVRELAEELGLTSGYSTRPVVQGHLRSPIEMAGLDDVQDQSLRSLLEWLLTAKEADAETIELLAKRLGINQAEYLQQVQPYLTAEQICALRATGFTIGAHGRSHRMLQSMSRTDAEKEIVASCTKIRDLTGQATVPFAFPYSGGNVDRNWLAEIRARHGFVGLFFDTDGLSEDAPFVVQRIFGERFGYDTSLDAILRRAWSRPRAWRRVVRNRDSTRSVENGIPRA